MGQERNVLVDGGVDNIRTLAAGDWFAGLPRPLFSSITDLQPAGTTLETLATHTIDAQTLYANKQAIEIVSNSTFAANANRKRHYVKWNGTQIGLMDQSDAGIVSAEMRVRIVRESSTVLKCSSAITFSYTAAPGINSQAHYYTRITGLNLATTGYDITYEIQNSTLSTNSTLVEYAAVWKPA